MKAAIVIEAMNIVAAVPDPVAWNHTSYMESISFTQYSIETAKKNAVVKPTTRLQHSARGIVLAGSKQSSARWTAPSRPTKP
ncbi:MAG: hypothetical protein Q9172_007649 [Xanthocarpia lactea]